MRLLKTLLQVALPLFCAFANAQTPPPLPAASTAQAALPRVPCSAIENRQFDFWIGDWDVFTPDGKSAGTNLIKPVLASCVLLEAWLGRNNYAGQSVNIYDSRRKVWHQTWVDNTGLILLLDGRFENGVMTLSDRDTPGKADRNAFNEIIWTPNADGSVRQHWRASADGGQTWRTMFDGKYVKSSRPRPAR